MVRRVDLPTGRWFDGSLAGIDGSEGSMGRLDIVGSSVGVGVLEEGSLTFPGRFPDRCSPSQESELLP